MHCGALSRGVVFRDFAVRVISDETAEQIQVSTINRVTGYKPYCLQVQSS